MERRAGRTTVLGTMMLLLGSMTMIVGLVTPASADPGNGHAYGHHKDDASVVTWPDPAPDLQVSDTSGASAADTSANQDCGAYCPSGVGLPSGNGNATNQPCAGCVGNADDKNPPGQANDGSDHNNGYECDGNQGVGKTNPAHSGCQSTTTTVPQTTTTTEFVPCTGEGCPTTTTTQPSTTTTVPQTTTTTVAACTGQDCATTTTAPITVLGEQFTRPSTGASAGPLAFTGGVVGKLFFVGMALMLMGIVVLGHRARGVLANRD